VGIVECQQLQAMLVNPPIDSASAIRFIPWRERSMKWLADTSVGETTGFFYYSPDGRLKSFLANITDLFPIDAFTRISAGRSAFRVDDLLELRERLDRQRRGEGGQQDV